MCASTRDGSAILPPPWTTFAPRGAGPRDTRPSTTTRSVSSRAPSRRTSRKTTVPVCCRASPDEAGGGAAGAASARGAGATAAVVPAMAAAPASTERREKAEGEGDDGCMGAPAAGRRGGGGGADGPCGPVDGPCGACGSEGDARPDHPYGPREDGDVGQRVPVEEDRVAREPAGETAHRALQPEEAGRAGRGGADRVECGQPGRAHQLHLPADRTHRTAGGVGARGERDAALVCRENRALQDRQVGAPPLREDRVRGLRQAGDGGECGREVRAPAAHLGQGALPDERAVLQ